jgi:hypothetical protein
MVTRRLRQGRMQRRVEGGAQARGLFHLPQHLAWILPFREK